MSTGKCLTICLAVLTALTACSQKASGEIRLGSKQAALPAMEHIAFNASRCWFKSGDKAFKIYRLAPELQSFTDRPRILVVPYHKPDDKPLLVVEATGSPARITAYGPLMYSKTGGRIVKDIKRWVQGGKTC